VREHGDENDGNCCAGGEPVAGGERVVASGSTVLPVAFTPIALTVRNGTATAALTMARCSEQSRSEREPAPRSEEVWLLVS